MPKPKAKYTFDRDVGAKAPGTVFYAAADEWRPFVAELKRHINSNHWRIQVRGRGRNRRALGGNGQSLKLDVAEFVGIYLFPKRPGSLTTIPTGE